VVNTRVSHTAVPGLSLCQDVGYHDLNFLAFPSISYANGPQPWVGQTLSANKEILGGMRKYLTGHVNLKKGMVINAIDLMYFRCKLYTMYNKRMPFSGLLRRAAL
jgi:hypothetical protein